MSLPRFYAPAARANAGPIVLPADEAHHLTHVLRLRVGSDVAIFDGAGHEWTGRVASIGRREVRIDLGEAVSPVAEPSVRITLAMAVLKGDRMDVAVRDATALGVATIVPMTTAHLAVPARAWQSTSAIDRWQRVAVAAAKQSRRAVVPAVSAVMSFEAVLRRVRDTTALICVEPIRIPAKASDPNRSRPPEAWLLVGPEGGWTTEEVEAARGAGVEPLSLGPRTIRAELAPIVALSSLWTRWGW